MATWVARASTKGSGQTSLGPPRRREEEGPSKSLAPLRRRPPPLEEEGAEEDIWNGREGERKKKDKKVWIKTPTGGPKKGVGDSWIYINSDSLSSLFLFLFVNWFEFWCGGYLFLLKREKRNESFDFSEFADLGTAKTAEEGETVVFCKLPKFFQVVLYAYFPLGYCFHIFVVSFFLGGKKEINKEKNKRTEWSTTWTCYNLY